jgi:hypothetical protein
MTNRVLGGGFEFSVNATGGEWRWKVVTNNSAGASQKYQITDIRSPFGDMRSSDIPIPDSVLDSIHESLNTFREQLRPELLVTTPTNIPIYSSEGSPEVLLSPVMFTNTGALGSVMDVFVTSDVYWLSPVTGFVRGIGKNGMASVQATVHSDTLYSVGSPYVGTLSLSHTGSDQVVNIIYTVYLSPKPEITLDTAVLNFVYDISSDLASADISINVMNTGLPDSMLSLSVLKSINNSPWLIITGGEMENIPSGYSQTVMFSIDKSMVTKRPGYYQESLLFKATNNESTTPITVPVLLIVS